MNLSCSSPNAHDSRTKSTCSSLAFFFFFLISCAWWISKILPWFGIYLNFQWCILISVCSSVIHHFQTVINLIVVQKTTTCFISFPDVFFQQMVKRVQGSFGFFPEKIGIEFLPFSQNFWKFCSFLHGILTWISNLSWYHLSTPRIGLHSYSFISILFS